MNGKPLGRCQPAAVSAAVVALLLPSWTSALAQVQPGSHSEPDRSDLVKVKPDIVGLRNGKFIEPDPMDFASQEGFVSSSSIGPDGRRTSITSIIDGIIRDNYPRGDDLSARGVVIIDVTGWICRRDVPVTDCSHTEYTNELGAILRCIL